MKLSTTLCFVTVTTALLCTSVAAEPKSRGLSSGPSGFSKSSSRGLSGPAKKVAVPEEGKGFIGDQVDKKKNPVPAGLEGVECMRDRDLSAGPLVQYSSMSYKLIKYISDNAGIYEPYEHSYAGNRQMNTVARDTTALDWVYIEGFDVSKLAEEEYIKMDKIPPVYRIGLYTHKGRRYKMFTPDVKRALAETAKAKAATSTASGQ